ncbi:MAG: HEAT repeat domain-containing protein [Tunicatimonas sp.]|uniref:HEAT repeat domain-containing protein n=1 Tax=Tunicatimonas sp. TaxID=1940096 RepID=UPI003C78461C
MTILRKNKPIFLLPIIVSALSFSGCNNEEPVDLRIKEMSSEQEVAVLAKSIEATVSPELAEGLTLSLWAVDSLVDDPIALDIDDQGRVYYTRTQRGLHSEFDIRGHQDWEIESIQLQNVEERRSFLRKVLAPENSDQNEWLPDVNEDGSRDWRDLMIEKEKIYRVEDASGDGLADKTQLVVDGFNDEIDDVMGAVLVNGDDLFAGVAPNLWRIRDKNGDGIADEQTSISHGYGVHIGFGGHGMSGLEMGPDGKIYWGIGDIGFNGKGPDGKEWKYPNRGVLVRANPDGSDFEVFAMGLRNTHEFTFDKYGNIIGQDNDGDHRGESERLVYIVNGSDTGWRINWQFGKYKDPKNNEYKVWMDEGMYKPRFEGQAAYITPTIKNYVNGPTGFLYNPGTALGPKWKEHFFVASFVGNPTKSGIHAFKLNPKGATFELGETEQVMGGVLATGMDFGPDGAMYFADWIDGWSPKEEGRIWKLDAPSGSDWPERKQTQELIGQDFTEKNDEALGELLKNPDMRVRQKAQFELAKRGEDGAQVFQQMLAQTEYQLARVHSIWGISQLARQDSAYAEILLPLLQDADPEIQAQAAKWLGDMRYSPAAGKLVSMLSDDYDRTRFFAAEALGRIAYEPALEPLITLLETNNDEDTYIRHAASLAMARIGQAEPVVALADHPSRAVRIGAVVALRRMEEPGVAKFLNDEDEYIVTEAARAINDDYSIEAALPALGNVLQQNRFSNEALVRRAINANLRVGSDEALTNLLDYALNSSNPTALRAEAVAALGTWSEPSVLDRVDGRYRGEVKREPATIQDAAFQPLIQLASQNDAGLRLEAVRAVGRLGFSEGATQLLDQLKNDRSALVRAEALTALSSLEYDQIGKAIEVALTDSEKSVRVVGLDLMTKMDISPELMVYLLTNVIESNSRTAEEQQVAMATLGTLPVDQTKDTFGKLLTQLENGKFPPEILIELAEAIEETESDELNNRLEQIQAAAPESFMASYQDCLYGGDPEHGQQLVFRHSTAQCMKCHAYDDYGGNAGPRLNGIADRLSREQILEAIVNPSARIAPGYGVVTLKLENGETISGILQEENETEVIIKVGNQPDKAIAKAEIIEQTTAPSSMPNMTSYLSKKEIRDIVSFLSTLHGDEMQASVVAD